MRSSIPPSQADLTADDACRALGIQKATLYAYVSRGLIRSAATGTASRARRYNAEDVARLVRRRAVRQAPDHAADDALRWGAPVLETRLSAIAGGRYAYRGRDAVRLAETEPLERVAALLWAGDLGIEASFPDGAPDLPERVRRAQAHWTGLGVLEAMKLALPLAAADDPSAWRADPHAQQRAGGRIVHLLAAVAAAVLQGEGSLVPGARTATTLAESSAGAASRVGGTSAATPAIAPAATRPGRIATCLQRAWRPDAPSVAAALDAALVLCADHELNASSFAARVVAGAGSPPYDAVLAGLAALGGTRHGGHTARVAALLREVDAPDRAEAVLAERLRRGDDVPGFGQRLYPDGDPRFAPLFALAGAHAVDAAVIARVVALVAAVHALDGRAPTLDVGLVALERALMLPAGAALALFAVGRSVGWIAHALEQAAEGSMIRPRARYVGEDGDAGPGAP